MKKIIHSAVEPAPCNEMLLVINAKEGRTDSHAHTIIISGEIGETRILANIVSKDRSILPIAWCLASDAYRLIGFDKEDKEALFEMAKKEAWPWYKKD